MTQTRYYVNSNGVYIGGFQGVDPPPDAIEVPDAPPHAAQVWDGAQFGPPPPVESGVSDTEAISRVLINKGIMSRQDIDNAKNEDRNG